MLALAAPISKRGGAVVRTARNQRRSGLRRSTVATTAVVVAAVTLLVPAARAGTLDQSQPVIVTTSSFVSDQFSEAQTFTAGIGGRLDQVDVAVGKSSASVQPLVVELRAVTGGQPTGPVLASTTEPAASFPLATFPSAFTSVTFAAPAVVAAGTQYAIVLKTASCGFSNCFNWATGPVGSSYAAGSGFQSSDSGATWTPLNAFGSLDFTFKTYVASVPTAVADCKRGGWKTFTSPRFKNQGQCVAYVNHHDGRGQDDAKSQGAARSAAKADGTADGAKSTGKPDEAKPAGEKKGRG